MAPCVGAGCLAHHVLGVSLRGEVFWQILRTPGVYFGAKPDICHFVGCLQLRWREFTIPDLARYRAFVGIFSAIDILQNRLWQEPIDNGFQKMLK